MCPQPNRYSERNLTVELLRVVFMFLILSLHYLIHGFHHHLNGYVNVDGSTSFSLEMALIGLCNIGVTGFMFISGYYGIRYRPARLFSLWLQAAFYTLCLLLVLLFLTGRMHYSLMARFWLPFTNGGWWFLMCYAFVYILSPIINQGIAHTERREFKWILIIVGLMLYVGKFVAFALSTEFVLLLFIYLLGRYINFYGWQWLEQYSLLMALSGVGILIVVPYVLGYYEMSWALKMFFSNYNPIVVITAISIVFIGCRHNSHIKMHPFLLSLCSNTLAAYIITDYPPMREWIVERFIAPYGHSLTHAVLCVVVGFIVCLLVEEGRKRALSPIEKAVERKLAHVDRRYM